VKAGKRLPGTRSQIQFGEVQMPGTILTHVHTYWPTLIAGSLDHGAQFAAGARVSYPPVGQSEGDTAIAAYLGATHRWLVAQEARWEPVATTATSERVVDEGLLILHRAGEEIRLPVATVGEAAADSAGERIAWLRIYHSMWPLRGSHTVRPELLPGRHDLALSGAPAAYQEALARGDLESIMATFGPQACAREPSGGQYVYCGPAELRRFYGALFANGGGIALEHCTVTDDRVGCAIEYNAVAWGRTSIPPQAGVAVYERGPDGLLAAARIYDDVDPPV
jgi:hypothetical protein